MRDGLRWQTMPYLALLIMMLAAMLGISLVQAQVCPPVRSAPQPHTVTPAPTPAAKISPQAIKVLKGMSTYLASLTQFSVHGEVAHDVVLNSGEHLELHHAFDAFVERPNHLRVNFSSES